MVDCLTFGILVSITMVDCLIFGGELTFGGRIVGGVITVEETDD
jgi:hypothetical protein